LNIAARVARPREQRVMALVRGRPWEFPKPPSKRRCFAREPGCFPCASLIDAHVHPCNCAEVSAPCGSADEKTVSNLNTRAVYRKGNHALDPETGDRPHRFGGNHGPRRDCLSRMQVRIFHPETAELLV